jgi:hypothetical protein
MAYTIIFTMTVGAGEVFYHDTSAQAEQDAQFLKEFRINSPGFLGETGFEVISPTSERLTFVFEDETAYNNYRTSMRATAEWQRRQAYYDSIIYIPEAEFINSESVDTTGSSIES